MAAQGRNTELWIGVVVLIAALLLVPGMFLFGGFGTGMMGGGGSLGGWGYAGIGMVVVVIVILVAVVLLLPRGAEAPMPPPYPYAPGAPPPAAPANPTPVQILDARYARGEITREEYLRMRQDLENRTP